MTQRKGGGSHAASEENRGRNSPKQPYDAAEGLQRPYEDYDEDRESSDANLENDLNRSEPNSRGQKDQQNTNK